MSTAIMGEMTFTANDRVVFVRSAADAVTEQMIRMGAHRAFILARDSLRRDSEEIARIEAALEPRHAAT